MSEFIPVNSLEIVLRQVLRDRNTPLWNFYTPLAAATLWIFARHYPELDGSDEAAPPGQNPDICIFSAPEKTSYIGVYTAFSRAEAAFTKLKLNPQELTIISAPGYQLFRFLGGFDADLLINLGLPECQYYLDGDMVEILLSRPEPEPAKEEPAEGTFGPAHEVEVYLGPLRDFLASQSHVRAAWIMTERNPAPSVSGDRHYQVGLLMRDPEDDSLLEKVTQIAKALTPVEMEWQTGILMADEESFRRLAKQDPPFYQAGDFIEGRASARVP